MLKNTEGENSKNKSLFLYAMSSINNNYLSYHFLSTWYVQGTDLYTLRELLHSIFAEKPLGSYYCYAVLAMRKWETNSFAQVHNSRKCYG